MAAILPSVPLLPKPPGIRIPETPFSLVFISDGFKLSDSTLIKSTFRLFLIPPWISASSRDLYASFKFTYFPIIAIFTVFLAFKTILVIFFHGFKLTFFFVLILKYSRTCLSKFSLLKLIGAS